MNLNSKSYWESRYSKKKWDRSGKKQTIEYAKANVEVMPLSNEYNGTILDFGCSQGDAFPIYKQKFPNASLFGIDISENAIDIAIERYSEIAEFVSGTFDEIPNVDIIVASHIMEHIDNDKLVVEQLLKKCKALYIFVPFKENPLFVEHVNYYDEAYYDNYTLIAKKVFTVNYKTVETFRGFLKRLSLGRFEPIIKHSKEIIFYHIKGNLT